MGEDQVTLKNTILATKNVLSKLKTPRGEPFHPSSILFLLLPNVFC